MAVTRPASEQLRFRSANTGDHILDNYLEAAEKGGRSLSDILDGIFDVNGDVRDDLYEFRLHNDSGVNRLQYRTGDFVDPNAGWENLFELMNFHEFDNAETYYDTDLIRLSDHDIYIVHGVGSGGTTFANEAAVIASSNTSLMLNLSSGVTAAEAAQTAAETAQSNAETAQSAAETAQSAAETAETNAAGSASAASTSASNAQSAQTAAEAAQSAAEAAETSASGHASSAETHKTDAEAAKTAAETALDSFDDRYLGSKAADPSVDNDGDPLITGALYWNSVASELRVYDGANWIGGFLTATGSESITGLKEFDDDAFILRDPAAPTKKARLDAGAVTAGQTRVVSVPDANVSLWPFSAIGEDIVPDGDGTRELGSEANRWADVHLDKINGGALSGFRNRLQNPLFLVDIEGNAGGVTASGEHVVEGWRIRHSSAVTTLTGARIAGDGVPYALELEVTTGSDASIGASDYAGIETAIEGYDISDAMFGTASAKSVWVSGRIYAPTTGVYCLFVQNAAGNRSYVSEITVASANTWQDFEIEIPGDTSGTWDSTNGVGLLVGFTMACGTDYHGTADTWETADDRATSNQQNGLATNADKMRVEDIRVSVGGPIPTEYRQAALDESHCRRYYNEYSYFNGSSSYALVGAHYHFGFEYSEMRAAPTITKSSANAASLTRGGNFVYPNGNASSSNVYTAYLDARLI